MMLKLKAMNKCQEKFDAHLSLHPCADGQYDRIPLIKYDLQCININDVDEGKIGECEDISSVDMNEELSEESYESPSEKPSGSDSEEIRKFKNDQKVRQESKMMLTKLKTLLS